MDKQGFNVAFTRPQRGLKAVVTGERTLENTVAYWQRILGQIAEQRPEWLYVCDRLRGDELAIAEWRKLVLEMKGRGLEGLRIAHVKPSGLDHLEYCEIFAREAGIDARAFSDAGVADRWLRHGAEE